MNYYNLADKTRQLDGDDSNYHFYGYQQGDVHERNILIEKNIGLVQTVAKKYSVYHDLDDLIQVGCIGLIKAVDTFDINRCSKFSNYAGICIDNEIRMFLRKNYKHINIMSTDDESSIFMVDNILSCDVADLVLEYEEKEQLSILIKLIDNLPEMDRNLIILYFGLYSNKRHTQQQIADKFGQSRFTVGKKIKKIICELVNNMYNAYDIKVKNIKL